MPFIAACACGQKLQVQDDQYLGTSGTCPRCAQQVMLVPEQQRPKLPPRPESAKPPSPKTVEREIAAKETAEALSPISVPRWAVYSALLLLVANAVFSSGVLKAKTRWEYKIVSPRDDDFRKEMNELGEQGWELVFARRATNVLDVASYEIILRRPTW